MADPTYRGRFAPSPTGPLHYGSLVAAVGSYLDARAHNGEWLVRIEDIDTTRCSPHWSADILRTLEAFGLTWDGPVIYQTSPDRQAAYAEALRKLERDGLVYACGCSRALNRERARADTANSRGSTPAIYPGTCRNGLPPGKTARSCRLRVSEDLIGFKDRTFGPFSQNLSTSVGDFVLKRADGPVAYQLAVVVDDAEQGITDIVRGEDLLDNTPRQIYLQRLLGYPQQRYLHLRVVTNKFGQKLSKQTGAEPLSIEHAVSHLVDALEYLDLQPPRQLRTCPLEEIWRWAIPQWALMWLDWPPLQHGATSVSESGT